MRANRVQKVLVTDGTEVATVGALTPGAYVALVHGKAANTPIEVTDKFQLVVGKLNGLASYSDVIKAKDIISVKLDEYTAVTEQVSTVTFTAPTAGQEYLLTIVEKSDKEILQRRQDKRSYQVVAVVGETAATLASKFADLINADLGAHVTASATAAVLTITAKAKVVTANAAGQFGLQHFFDVGVSEVNPYGTFVPFGTVAIATNPNFGTGTFPQVRSLEQDAIGYVDGKYLNRTSFPVPLYDYDTAVGTTYDILTIEYDNEYSTNSVVEGKRNADPITIVIAVKAGETEDLETLFANFL